MHVETAECRDGERHLATTKRGARTTAQALFRSPGTRAVDRTRGSRSSQRWCRADAWTGRGRRRSSRRVTRAVVRRPGLGSWDQRDVLDEQMVIVGDGRSTRPVRCQPRRRHIPVVDLGRWSSSIAPVDTRCAASAPGPRRQLWDIFGTRAESRTHLIHEKRPLCRHFPAPRAGLEPATCGLEGGFRGPAIPLETRRIRSITSSFASSALDRLGPYSTVSDPPRGVPGGAQLGYGSFSASSLIVSYV